MLARWALLCTAVVLNESHAQRRTLLPLGAAGSDNALLILNLKFHIFQEFKQVACPLTPIAVSLTSGLQLQEGSTSWFLVLIPEFRTMKKWVANSKL